jgi:alpha-D-ribose 1-methylphosphonate 5-triphosphate diphosphatase
MKTLITGATLVLPDRVVEDGSLLLEDERILAICPVATYAVHEVEAEGALLLPGLVDLHGDAFEKEVEPRPKVAFPLPFAVAQIDRRCALAGVTTPFHALSFAGREFGVRNDAMAAACIDALRSWRGLVDNRVHVRYEVTVEGAAPIVAGLVVAGKVDLLSFMDHTPGQGQFRTPEAFAAYYQGAYAFDDAAVRELIAGKRAGQASASARVLALAGLAREHGVAMASHDDDSVEQVQAMRALGASISEFPIDLSTAKAARAAGLCTLFGAPNIVRGGSQSGNMRALDAVLAGVCGALCSDYHPPALVQAVLALPELAGITLPVAVALATSVPALAAGLHDRGRIEPGLRADLIAVRSRLGVAQVERTWVAGRLVLDAAARPTLAALA